MNKTKSNALPIAIMFALFAMISFVTGFQSPMAVIVKAQFGADNFLSQLGTFANFIAYAFMGIPAGLMLKRKGYKITSLAAVTVGFAGVGLMVVAGLFGGTGSLVVYLLGAFVGGFSMCMLNVVVNPLLNTLGGGGKKGGQLIQFGGSLNSISATIVPIIVGYIIGNKLAADADGNLINSPMLRDAWPVLFIAMAIFALAFIVLALAKIPEPHIEKKAGNKQKEKYGPLSFRHFTLGALAIFIYVGVEVGIPGIANLYMTASPENGGLGNLMDPTMAGTVVGTYWFLMFVGRLLGGLMGGKLSSRTMLGSMSLLAIILVLAGMFSPVTTLVKMPVLSSGLSFGLVNVPVGIMLFALCGLCTSVMWGAIFNLAVEGLGKYTAAASGIFMVMVCGGGILPALQGWIADVTSFTASYWIVVAGFAYMLFYALAGSRNVNKEIDSRL